MNSNNAVQVHTSLPPCIKKIDPFFCLHFQIDFIKFTTKSSFNYDNISARVIWWGEEGKGAIFTPRCVNLAGYKQNIKSYALYQVCVPLNHFATYLSDMDKLCIDIIDKSKQTVMGRAFVENIKQLCCNKTLRALCSIFNEQHNKIGEVSVVMTIEHATANFSINNSGKTTENSSEIVKNTNKMENNGNNESKSINSKDKIIIDDESTNLIDDLIAKGRKLREKIAINVKDDEINEEIARKTFPNLGKTADHHKSNDDWLKKMLLEQSDHQNVSLNEISKINTESILIDSAISSPNFERKRFFNIADKACRNNDIEALKLVAASDSESNIDFDCYNPLTKSVEDIVSFDNKHLSSDDDPCKRDSIIEELFYKEQQASNDENTNRISSKKQQYIESSNNKINSVKSAFEIYKDISQSQRKSVDEVKEEDHIENTDDDNDISPIFSGPHDRTWYRNISSIKIFLDTLWLNPVNQSANKSARSRSQSPNYSSDRERCRRSQDSASSFNNSSLSTSGSKPPVSRSLQWNSSCKYFIEYNFPSCAVERGEKDKENNSIPRCPIRVGIKSSESTKNPANNAVKVFELNYTSEFPVSFNNSTIGQWWKGNVRFRLICQDLSNKETVVAVSVLPLRNVISTNNFYRLIPMRLPRTKVNKARVVIGSLAVRSTMVMSHTDSGYNQKSHENFQGDFRRINSIQNHQRTEYHVPSSIVLNQGNNTHQPLFYRPRRSEPLRHTIASSSSTNKMNPLNLVSLLSVSSVRYINTKMVSGDYRSGMKNVNLYFVGRLLWAPDHNIKSRILWGSSKITDAETSVDLENFKLSEKTPLILTSDLMDKLKNNFAILEVWDKSMDNKKDSLYGLVKIPMNIICLSYSNDHIRSTVQKNVYPVMCCDDWINIEDTLTGKSKGQIHVLLALGSHQQIDNLQLSKENTVDGHWNRNFMASTVSGVDLVEHIIEIDLESLRNVDFSSVSSLTAKDSFCYIQYYFPQQQSITDSIGKSWNTTVFRSVSHPTQANIDISDTNMHRFRLPMDCSLKGALNNHFETMGKKHILFELFLKQYDPFPNTKSLAKGRLQMSSLFQLINQHSVSVDSMANTLTQQQIPVRLVSGDDSDTANSIGVLNLCVCYKTKLLENNRNNLSSSNLVSPLDQPIVKIEIMSAIGLQNAAETLVRIHPELEYASVTGVNSHVKYWITDESNKQSRINVNSKGFQKFKIHKSKTVARSFVPKYDDINEVLLGSIIDDRDANVHYRSLAEKILTGVYQLNLEVYHDVPKSIYCDFEENSSLSSILIGKGRISLVDILLRSNGIMGPIWLTLFSPINLDSRFGGCKLNITGKKIPDSLYSIEKRKAVGAVEIRLSFNDKADRRNILQLAMDIGYVVPWTTRLETEDLIWQSMDVHGCSFKYVTVTVEEIELSNKLINCVFTSEAGFKRSSMKIITRYRLYKQAIASSPYFILNEEELAERIFIPVNHQQQYCYRVSSDLYRYLRESKLEVQVWAIYGSALSNYDNDYEPSENPNDVRLLGSSFFDLSNLILPTDPNRKTVSNILPLWKRGISNCDNANITVAVDICGATSPLPDYTSDNEENEYGSKESKGFVKSSNVKVVGTNRLDSQKSFPAHIIIEKAVNLIGFVSKNGNNNINYFVTFPSYEDSKDIQSTIIKGSKDITWNFECDTRLPYTLLTDSASTLDFKVYHCQTESNLFEEINDQKTLTGVVKIDLSLLLKGFERVIGWYNIVDMQGDCQGQIKVGVTPLVPLVPRSACLAPFKQTLPSSEVKPFSIEDHQEYLAKVRMRLHGDANPIPPFSTTVPYNSVINHSNQQEDCRESLSKSILYSTLKEKLRELDNINETFKRKISKDEIIECSGNDNNNAVVDVFPPELTKSMEKIDEHFEELRQKNSFENSFDFEERGFVRQSYDNCSENNFNESNTDSFGENDQEENISKMICLNDRDDVTQFNIKETNSDEDNVGNSLSLVENKENQHATYSSDSECSSILSGDMFIDKPTASGRSSSCSVNRRYDDEEIDEIIEGNNQHCPEYTTFNNDLNDSWNSATFKHQTDVHEEIKETSTPKLVPKKSIIPRFFPPSIDFQEKMKALKKNIDINSTKDKVMRNSDDERVEMKKRKEVANISEGEVERLSRIFGITKR